MAGLGALDWDDWGAEAETGGRVAATEAEKAEVLKRYITISDKA